jgi:hypothetical protein
MRRLNANALAAFENGKEIFIEDVADSDARLYRIEYRCNPDGNSALAYCLYSPWLPPPYDMLKTHLMNDRSICTTTQAHRGGDNLERTVQRARLWCEGYSCLCEHGYEATRAAFDGNW